MKIILAVLLLFIMSASIGVGCGWMFVKHGAAFTYFMCAVIGGALMLYWGMGDEC